MKVLTIKEPWASLIIEGYKNYEFRSWKTSYRGKILIHAGKRIETEYLERFQEFSLHYEKGAIVGEAELTDCILVDEELNQKLYEMDPNVYGANHHVKNYAWKLENVKKYQNPILISGKLGLWNYEGEIENDS